MYIPRTLENIALKASKSFPALVITGPRQSGKTTLLKRLFKDSHKFVSLENPDIRAQAIRDPKGFLAINKPPVIIDEIQYVPSLLSYIKTEVDESRIPGNWVLTGSQNFPLMNTVSESLAGRAAILKLLPMSLSEITGAGQESLDISSYLSIDYSQHSFPVIEKSTSEWILDGGYPELVANKDIDREIWFSSYIATYLERDVRNLSTIVDLTDFSRFLTTCAFQTGKIVNMSSMANDIGVSVPTIKRWISILETSGIIFLLSPYHSNPGKRIRKSPKLYFVDSGLAAYLMGFRNGIELEKSHEFGHLFESAVIADFYKRIVHHGKSIRMYYMQSMNGIEVDCVIEYAAKLYMYEVKSARTAWPDHAKQLLEWVSILGDKGQPCGVISAVEQLSTISPGIYSIPWQMIVL